MNYLVSIPDPYLIDLVVAQFFQGFQASWFRELMQLVSFFGNDYNGFIFLLIISVILAIKQKKVAIWLVASTLGSIVISTLIKHYVFRVRPIVDLPPDSFPSGHVLIYMGLFGFLFYIFRKKKVAYLLLIPLILVGISRIYLGYHWFSDVVTGYIIGALWLTFIIKLYNKIR